MYFVSDGYIGMGGLDVFRALRAGAGIGRIENLGYPFNSPQDDFAFSLNEKGGIAYLSSNRANGLGGDDIYVFDQKMILDHMEPIELKKGIRLENIYYDFEEWNIRADAAVELDKLIKIMNDNPIIWIELGSH